MNLVQINERLKDLPMQVIQQYANGMNPEVPPYLALGELQRRETAQKQMATAQGGMQGPQPSIKEQVEQKAGLMAAQGLQQQQAMQQMGQPRGPMPVPAGIPQPEDQPEAMARGGLASIPVRGDMFEYADGGIVAFQSGGDVDAARQEAKDALARLRTYGLRQRQQDPEGYQAAEQAAAAAQEKRQAIEAGYAKEMSASGVDRPAMNRQDIGAAREAMQQAAAEPMVTSQGPGMPVAPRRPIEPAGLPAALPKPAPRPPMDGAPAIGVAPRIQPAAPQPQIPGAGPVAGLPAAAAQGNVTPYMKKLEDMISKEPVAPTEEGVISSVGKLTPELMQDAAMQKRAADQRARVEQERAAYEKSRPSGLDELIRVFGQAGQYKGLSGMAPAYTAMQQQKRAEDLAMEKRQNELMTAIEGKEYEGAKEQFGARTKAFDTAKQLFGKEKDTIIKSAADLAQVDQTRINNEMRLMSDEKLKRLELASRAADRAQQGAGLAMKADYLAKMAKSRALAEAGDTAAAARLAAEANDILMVSGVGATSERNDIKATETLLKNQQAIISDPLTSKADKDAARAKAAVYIKQLEQLGGATASGAPSGKVPAVGTVMDGYKFKGGNPADQKNWEKV